MKSNAKSVENQRDEHCATDEDQEENEQGESERAEKSIGHLNVTRIEFQEKHLEEHLRGQKNGGTRPDLRREEKIEECDEGEDHEGEHHSESEQFPRGIGQGAIEQRQTSIQTRETEQFQCAKVTTQTGENGEHLIGIGNAFEIGELISIALKKDISHARHLARSPKSKDDTRTRTSDDTPFEVRPNNEEIPTFQSVDRTNLLDRRINNQNDKDHGTDQMQQRRESFQIRMKDERIET